MKWIIVQPDGGLCNRLRVLVSSLILAECMGRKPQLLWRPNAVCNCEFYDLFQYDPLTNVVPHWCDRLARFLLPRQGIGVSLANLLTLGGGNGVVIDQQGLGKLDYKINLSDFEDYPFIYFRDCYSDFIPAHFSPEDYSEKASSYLNRFKPVDFVSEKLFDLPSPTIGVHIRCGDNKKSVQTSSLDRFVKKMKQCLNMQPQNLFFLATDEPAVEIKLKEIFPEKIITFTKSSFDRKKKICIQEALVDLLMLSRCDRILGSFWSTFSEYASMFRGIELYIVGVGFWEGPGYAILRRSRS